jgi:phosphate acetyltransferase
MDPLTKIKERAKGKKRHVVLPEGTEPRMIEASKKIVAEQIASVTLLGDEKTIARLAGEHGLDTNSVQIVDPASSSDFDGYVDEFMEMRKAKGITKDQAKAAIANPLYFGAMMVRHDKADGSVAGSINTTGDVLRAAIQVLGLKEGIEVVSSCFMMTLPKYMDEENKVFLYAGRGQGPGGSGNHQEETSAFEGRRRAAGGCGDRAKSRRQQSPRLTGSGQCQRPDFPGPGRRQHRLQADTATGRGYGHRSDYSGTGQTGQRPLPWLLGG